MEEHLDAKGVMQQTNRYQPRVDPRDEESDYLPINIDRITGMSNIDRFNQYGLHANASCILYDFLGTVKAAPHKRVIITGQPQT